MSLVTTLSREDAARFDVMNKFVEISGTFDEAKGEADMFLVCDGKLVARAKRIVDGHLDWQPHNIIGL